MKILVIGSGGREHALVWKLRQSPAVEKLWCAPGNGGIADDCECFPLDVGDVKAAADLAANLGADLTIVGPELPLVNGIADEFASRGLALLGPTRQAAQLEGSKIFAKQFMQRHKIPTASVYGVYDSISAACTTLATMKWPVVIKADGLCAGKGVLVTSSREEAASFIERAIDGNQFGPAGKQIFLEEGLSGEELSYIILTDGRDFVPLVPTRDYKRAHDGDRGPNTGGMGAYSTDSMLPPGLEKKIRTEVVLPTLAGLAKDGIPYQGFLYFGLMITANGPKVLEFNCRLGDPETQAIMLRTDFDLARACEAAVAGQIGAFPTKWHPGASACVVIASEGYPDKPGARREIDGLRKAAAVKGAVVFHAATVRTHNMYYTCGGRILAVGALGPSLLAVRRTMYGAASNIHIVGSYCRHDIGGSKVATRAVAERS